MYWVYVDKFLDSSWVRLISFVIGPLGLLSLISRKKRKFPALEFKSNNLIDNFTSKYNGLKIKLNDQDCENLTVTRLTFWNKGGLSIMGSDIAPADKLIVRVVDGLKIFSVQIVAITDSSNNFRITNSKNFKKVFLNFDYLDKNDGAVIQIVHSGKSSEDILVSGSVIGFGKLRKNTAANWFFRFINMFEKSFLRFFIKVSSDKGGDLQKLKSRIMKTVTGYITLMMPILYSVSVFLPQKPATQTFASKIVFVVFMFIFYYPLGFVLIRRMVPKKLDIL